MSSPATMRRPALAALAIGATLPSGGALADDANFGRSPALWLAQATVPSITQPAANVLVLDASQLTTGAMIEHDGPIRIYGDIVGTGPRIEIRTPDLEVFGSVTGPNIHLLTQPLGGVDLHRVDEHTARLKIHGDVQVLNGHIGGAGTGELDVLGNVSLSGFRAATGMVSSMFLGREVCVAGSLDATGIPHAVMVGADDLRVGRDVTGADLNIGVYSVGSAMTHIREEGELPSFPGSALIGGSVLGDRITISNGEVSIGGIIQGADINIMGQRSPLLVLPEDVSCEDPAALSDNRHQPPAARFG
ncbi:MAG: hypothetical protein KI792_13310 [Alphaproteobacteria bacterium]|nr:hypothetical protein [Alphaproteobacteria bacterium SS10]